MVAIVPRLGDRVLILFAAAGISELGIRRFEAKITDSNDASMALFQALGYREERRVEVFHEVHFSWEYSPDAYDRIIEQTGGPDACWKTEFSPPDAES